MVVQEKCDEKRRPALTGKRMMRGQTGRSPVFVPFSRVKKQGTSRLSPHYPVSNGRLWPTRGDDWRRSASVGSIVSHPCKRRKDGATSFRYGVRKNNEGTVCHPPKYGEVVTQWLSIGVRLSRSASSRGRVIIAERSWLILTRANPRYWTR